MLFWNCLSISLPNGDDVVVDNDEKKDDDVNDTDLEQREPEGRMRGQEQQTVRADYAKRAKNLVELSKQ